MQNGAFEAVVAAARRGVFAATGSILLKNRRGWPGSLLVRKFAEHPRGRARARVERGVQKRDEAPSCTQYPALASSVGKSAKNVALTNAAELRQVTG